ncbi:hypothetical protein P154DRAFT_521959 [Amniculicola lignicola CBS 123094]|uniref:Uncharacterized protein n=1 Tax=Amniculicola lignicola CBS 123094 TaxID=1392246 RepID=A0A6A5WM76_9PLEO|nr:hypothetical protein P154DRAFT_521959 [Amniculicola lignicola CBS 123094]
MKAILFLLVLLTTTILSSRVPATPHSTPHQRRLLSFILPSTPPKCAKGQKLCTASSGESICADRYATCCEWALLNVKIPFTCPSDHPRCCSPNLTNLLQMMCGNSEKDNCLGAGLAATLRSQRQNWSLKRLPG